MFQGVVGAALSTAPASASQAVAADAARPATRSDESRPAEILVTGRRDRRSATGDLEPLALLGQSQIQELGANGSRDLLKRLKALAGVAPEIDPVTLLNGRRVSGIGEIEALPPEAIDRTEILRAEDAVRFGFAPTTPVLNFITKKDFSGRSVLQLAGTTTEGGGGTNYTEATFARIKGPRRFTFNSSYFRQNPVFQDERGIVPDPGARFASPGNVTGIGGATIGGRLEQLVGRPVAIVPVPDDRGARGSISSYVSNADRPIVTDVGAFRSLQQRNDMAKLNVAFGAPIGGSIDASATAAMDAQRNMGLTGPAAASLQVPAGNPYLPFGSDVALYRYLPGAVLRQRSTSLNLRGGFTLQGGLGRWIWNAAGAYDRNRSVAASDVGPDIDGLQSSIIAGGDPFLDPSGTRRRILRSIDRSIARTVTASAFASGPLAQLPAGPVQVTLSTNNAWSAADVERSFSDSGPLSLRRTIDSGSVSVSLPIASAGRGVLPALGRMSATATIGLSHVSGFGSLTSDVFVLSWTPVGAIQLVASTNRAQTAPPISLLADPVLVSTNVPFFDYASGSSPLVTTVSGGNPDLAPERRRDTKLGIAVKPLASRELRLSIDYVDTAISGQSVTLNSTTDAFRAAFPDRFGRDDAGRLSRIDLRPVNIDHEHERKLQATLNLTTPIGRSPPETPAPSDAGQVPVSTTKPRPTVAAYISTTYRLSDEIVVRRGGMRLDLLDGATLTGSGGRPRWQIDGELSGSLGPISIGSLIGVQGGTRVRSDLAESDLRFSGRVWLVPYGSLDAGSVVHRPWARGMSVQITVENVFNDRIDVHDRNGRTPNRFQSAYLDPIGRSVRLGVRKKF